jgi:ubiquinone/menaquinone biosynthesis C-methylase UbiE
MNIKDKEQYIKRYIKRYKRYGYSPLSLGWGKGGRQDLRFRVLSEVGILYDSSVLDVGCGFGDLFNYLKKQGWRGDYVGLDIVDDLLTEARKQFPEIEVRNIDILTNKFDNQFDYVVSSGIFNARLYEEDNYDYIFRMLKKMFEISKIGVAVDFMSSYVDFKHTTAFHAEPEVVFSLMRKLSKRIILRHDYMPYEFAVYIYKNDEISLGNIFVGSEL